MARPERLRRVAVVIAVPPELLAAGRRALAPHLPDRSRGAPDDASGRIVVHHVGDVPMAARDRTLESIARAAAGLSRFELTLDRLVGLPRAEPARKIALTGAAPAPFRELKSRLVRRFARKPREDGAHDFEARLTLLELEEAERVVGFDEALADDLIQRLDVREIVVERSAARPGRFEHVTIASLPLADR